MVDSATMPKPSKPSKPAAPPAAVAEYLAQLPADRREMLGAILDTIRANIDPRFEEGLQYGMPAFFLPHSEYPAGYHCDPQQPLPFAGVASTKGGASLHLFCIYTDPAESGRFAAEWKATGKRLDMGKSCVRVKRLDQVPLDVVGRTIARVTADDFVRSYEAQVPGAARGAADAPAAKKSAVKKTAAKQSAAKKPAAKTTPSKRAAGRKAR